MERGWGRAAHCIATNVLQRTFRYANEYLMRCVLIKSGRLIITRYEDIMQTGEPTLHLSARQSDNTNHARSAFLAAAFKVHAVHLILSS